MKLLFPGKNNLYQLARLTTQSFRWIWLRLKQMELKMIYMVKPFWRYIVHPGSSGQT
jgi:hypothetical protein